MHRERIHNQLLTDCHHLGSLDTSEVLLNRNAVLPWFILVPDTRVNDLLDLPQLYLEAVMADCAAVSTFIKEVLGFDKVNFAGLGNVVPQMHLHIIGRRPGDPCWPQPVWGNLSPGRWYDSQQLRAWQTDLENMQGLVPVELLD